VCSTADARPTYQLHKLWSYHCVDTEGLVVTGMAWNRINRDLLAVAYSSPGRASESGAAGMVMFWSMTNPEFPQQTLRTKAGVTAIDFSVEHPNLLAAGLYDGTICIYDAKKVRPWRADSSCSCLV
jgi:WD40 repeat protein